MKHLAMQRRVLPVVVSQVVFSAPNERRVGLGYAVE